jgi:putative sterol carrier protein
MAEQTKKAEDAPKTDKVLVAFTKPWSRYSRGDIAGFSAEEAERLVKGKVAVKGTKLPATKADQEPEPKA